MPARLGIVARDRATRMMRPMRVIQRLRLLWMWILGRMASAFWQVAGIC